MSDSPIVVNATAFWACVTSQNPLSGKYQVDLCQLSEAAVEALSAQGINVKNKNDERAAFITVKSNNEIRYYDKSGENITGVLIGNGSKVKAVLGYFDWTSPTGKAGRSASLKKMVVTELVDFEGSDDIAVDLEEAL